MRNQDIWAESLKKIDPEELVRKLSPGNWSNCRECPAWDFCNKWMLFDGDSVERIPDANGDVLECEEIFVKWLKEEAMKEEQKMTGKDILVEAIKNTDSKRIAHYLSHNRNSKFSITEFGCDNCPIFNSKEECKEYKVWMMKTCEDILLEWLEEEQDEGKTPV